jgi:hypothetical protein
MLQLAVVYEESDKRYIIPIEAFKDVLDEETIERLKAKALKEIQK